MGRVRITTLANGGTMSRHVFGITYGRAKSGKTVGMVRAFPGGLFITVPGGCLSAKHLGWEPKVLELEANQGLRWVSDTIRRAAGKVPAIIVDDLSLIADAELELCRRRASGFQAFDLFNKRVYELRDASRSAGCHVFFTAHEGAPREVKKDNNSRYIPGSPLMPGWQIPEKLPAMADVVARVVHDPTAKGWDFSYEVGPDQNYVTGDRLDIFPPRFPMNLREAMIAAGYDLPRPEALRWMDEHVDEAADRLQEESAKKKPDTRAVLTDLCDSMDDRDPRHVRWVLTDAMDRATLRRHESNLLNNFVKKY